jgi:methoxymalonate biosynthesis acyl carrier protein
MQQQIQPGVIPSLIRNFSPAALPETAPRATSSIGELVMQVDTKLIKLIEFVKKDLARGKGVTDLSEADDLVEAEVMDSLGIMKLILFLEENFGIKISDEDLTLENFRSIETIYSLVEEKLGSAGETAS